MGKATAFGAGGEGACHLVDLALLFCFQERVIEFCLKRGWTDPGSCPNDLHLNVFL